MLEQAVTYLLGWLLCILLLSFSFIAFDGEASRFSLKHLVTPRRRILQIVFAILGVIALVGIPFFGEFADDFSHLPDVEHVESQVVEVKEGVLVGRGTFIWCTDDCYKIPSVIHLSASVTPITQNPKVREISYSINVEVSDAALFVKEMGSGMKSAYDMKRSVRYFLYEFNNKHSIDLAEFYNPLDRSQQYRLEGLIMDYMNERLYTRGLSVSELTGFSVK